jgi:hypothetical protein
MSLFFIGDTKTKAAIFNLDNREKHWLRIIKGAIFESKIAPLLVLKMFP